MAEAIQVNLLLSSIHNNSGIVAAGGTATFYAPGTTSLKSIWEDAQKENLSQNPVTLSEKGNKAVFGDGQYDVLVKDKNGNVLDDFEGLTFTLPAATQILGINVQTFGNGNDAEAIRLAIDSAAGADAQLFLRSGRYLIDEDLVIPSNIQMLYLFGAYWEIETGITVTFDGTLTAPLYNIFRGTGTLLLNDKNNNVPSIWLQNGVHGDRTLKGVTTLEGNAVVTSTTGTPSIINKEDASSSFQMTKQNRISATPTNNDEYYNSFVAENDNDEQVEFVRETIKQTDVADGTEASEYAISVADGAGALQKALTINPEGGSISGNFSNTGDFKTDGSFTSKLVSKVSTYTAANERVILVDATAGPIDINLSTAVGTKGIEHLIKKIDSSINTVTIKPDGSETIDSATNFILKYKNDSAFVFSDDLNWESIRSIAPDLVNVSSLNLGISLSGSTFSVTGSNGQDLSPINPAFIKIPSKSNPGRMVQIAIKVNQSFEDQTGASEIIGNTFGTTAGVAWAEDIPFYLYAVLSDDEQSIAFMISRVPHLTTSPGVGGIGAPGDPVADSQGNVFSLESITKSLYDGNPCMALGSFRMQKDVSDDWTVQVLNSNDGINLFNENTYFIMPKGQNGAEADRYFEAPAPNIVGITPGYLYKISKNGVLTIEAIFDTSIGGGGAAPLTMFTPLLTTARNSLSIGTYELFPSIGFVTKSGALSIPRVGFISYSQVTIQGSDLGITEDMTCTLTDYISLD